VEAASVEEELTTESQRTQRKDNTEVKKDKKKTELLLFGSCLL
jgi:hypothetical protein